MGFVSAIDQGVRKLLFSLFWWFIDPLDKERLLGQLKDTIERNLDVNNPDIIIAPDSFEILVNNKIFIKHAHSVGKLESVLCDHLQRYAADRDYELSKPRISLQILSSATLSRHKADIRCWFATERETSSEPDGTELRLQVVAGEGEGLGWNLTPGQTYKIGRLSSANICLPFDKISKSQATLYFVSDDEISIVDENSANGTYIDDEDERITGSRKLQVGSKIRFCKLDPIILTISAE